MDATAVRQVSNASGEIYLFDLYQEDGSFSFEPCLVFNKAKVDSCWDNSDYVFNFFRRLKKNKKEQIKELKNFCDENEFNFEQTRIDLIDIYKTAKQLKFYENTNI